MFFFFFFFLLLIRCVLVFLIKTRILQFFLGAMFGSPSQFTLHHDSSHEVLKLTRLGKTSNGPEGT